MASDKEELLMVRSALADARAKLVEQDKYLQQINEEAHSIGTVIDVRDDRMTVSADGLRDVLALKGAVVGDMVTLAEPNHAPIAILANPSPTGIVAIVKEVHPNVVEIEIDGSVRAVRASISVEAGERVVVDSTLTALLSSLGKPKPPSRFEPSLNVSWDDVGGNEEAKLQLREAIEMPYTNAALYKKYGKKPVKGVLLSGPPGCGKTLLAKAAATAIARVHGKEKAEGFTYVKGPQLLSKWVGESEANIRALFDGAREHQATHGYPALVFIDEADAVFGSRQDDRLGITSTTVPQFLAEMDGLEETGALFILATNRPEALDAAVVREGRIDRKVRVNRPNQVNAADILEIHLRGRPLDANGKLDELVREDIALWTAEQVFSGKNEVKRYGAKVLDLRDAVSGAMLAGIVEEASTRALMRDVEKHCFTGIGREDMGWAVARAATQLRDTDHREMMATRA